MNRSAAKINFCVGFSEEIHLYSNKGFYFHMKKWAVIQSDMILKLFQSVKLSIFFIRYLVKEKEEGVLFGH